MTSEIKPLRGRAFGFKGRKWRSCSDSCPFERV